jgi:hypothetical protein
MTHDSSIERKGAIARKIDSVHRETRASLEENVAKQTSGVLIGVIGPEDGVELASAKEEECVYFKVRLEPTGTVHRIKCGISYDELRNTYGTDDNIIGREVEVTHTGESWTSISGGKARIISTRGAKYANLGKESNVASTAALYGGLVKNPRSMLLGFEDSDPQYRGDG